MTHDPRNCERCWLDQILYGETFYEVKDGAFIGHIDPRSEVAEAFKRRQQHER